MVGGEELIARRKLERAHHRVDADGGVGHEGEIVPVGADENAQRGAGVVEEPLQVAEELPRLPLGPGAQLGLLLQHRQRAGSEGAVVEEIGLPIERPVAGELATHASAPGEACRRTPLRRSRARA